MSHSTSSAPSDVQGRIVRGSVMSLANQAIKAVSNLVTILILAVYLGPDEFGLIAYALSIQADRTGRWSLDC